MTHLSAIQSYMFPDSWSANVSSWWFTMQQKYPNALVVSSRDERGNLVFTVIKNDEEQTFEALPDWW